MDTRNALIISLKDKMSQRSKLKPKEYYSANDEGADVEQLFGDFIKLTKQIDEIMLTLLSSVVTESILHEYLDRHRI
jgi:hypothetical protein